MQSVMIPVGVGPASVKTSDSACTRRDGNSMNRCLFTRHVACTDYVNTERGIVY